MNGALFSLVIVIGIVAKLCLYRSDHLPAGKGDRKHVWERGAAAVAAVGTFCGLLSVSGWLGAAWNDVGQGIGLLILIIVTGGAVGFGGFAIIRGYLHHRHSTLAVGIVAGAAIALFYGDFTLIKLNIGKALSSAGHGITGAPKAVSAATAHTHAHATAGHASSVSGYGTFILLLLLLAGVILAVIAIRLHRNGEVKNVGGALKAIGGGKGQGGGLPVSTAFGSGNP